MNCRSDPSAHCFRVAEILRCGADFEASAPPRKASKLPNRILREGILRSERIAKLPPQAELFYRRLMSVADDFGRYYANISILLSDCFPLRPSWATEDAIATALTQCVEATLLAFYEVNGTAFIEIQNFNQRIRAGQNSKFPESAGIRGNPREFSASCARTPTTPTPPTTPNSSFLEEIPESENRNSGNSKASVPETALAISNPDENPVDVVRRTAEVYEKAGRACPENQQQQAIQLLMSTAPERRIRLLKYVEWALESGLWSTAPKTKSLINLMRDGDWDVDVKPRTLPPAKQTRMPSASEQATLDALAINRSLRAREEEQDAVRRRRSVSAGNSGGNPRIPS